MSRFQWREHRPSILVASLSAAFGVALLQVTSNLAVMIGADDTTGSSGLVQAMLTIVALVFIIIATYVGAVVTANTFSTIIAGRTRTIALLRLIGASAESQRRAVAREGLLVGVIGTVVGAFVGTGLAFGLVSVGVATTTIPALAYRYLDPVLAIPVVAVILTTWAASWVGSRRVLRVTPIQATGAAVDSSADEVSARTGRNTTAVVLVVSGGLALAAAVVLGLVNPLAVLVGVLGGILSFTGVILAAPVIMPRALRLVGRLFVGTAAGRLAAENSLRYPERSARTTIGLVIGVTLVTMFAVAAATFERMLSAVSEGAGVDDVLSGIVAIFSVLIGFSALIAAVGMVNNLSLSVYQRSRELGLLRALGFTKRQLRDMVRVEAAQLTVAAMLVGLVLGVVYGWAGAQSLLGTAPGVGGLVFPVVPWWLLAVVVVAGALLTVAASVVPTRRATGIAPVVALAVE